MRLKAIRPFHLLTFAGIVGVSIAMTAQTRAKGPAGVHFTATTDNVSGAGDTVRINLFNWSTDADRDQLLAAWTLTAPAAAARGGGGRGGAAPAPADGAPPADGADGSAAAAGRGARGGRGRGGATGAPASNETPESSLAA